jgi:hypothetical protein
MEEIGQSGSPAGLAQQVDVPVPEAPHTIKQNWMPFLTFFFLRILI